MGINIQSKINKKKDRKKYTYKNNAKEIFKQE